METGILKNFVQYLLLCLAKFCWEQQLNFIYLFLIWLKVKFKLIMTLKVNKKTNKLNLEVIPIKTSADLARFCVWPIFFL